MTDQPRITVRFFRLSEELQPYFTALYLTVIDARDGLVADHLHPEWAAMRFTEGPPPIACIGPGELVPQWPFVGSGPTSKATHFAVRTSRVWGLGLQPAGWARFASGSAAALANRTVDGSAHPAFATFAAILPQIIACKDGDEAKAQLVNAHLLAHGGRADRREDAIFACQEALRDPALGEVAALQERLGMPVKTLERFCRRYFGFPPKLLLRRQRFARSLAQFMLDPSMSWIDALDGQYHDQAQFVREFREFMGMLPSEYSRMPHPIVQPIMRQRMVDQGAAEPLDLPTVARFR
ncbi:helix-turn-helix domain-containing protein [Tsuneonella sp. YG55]|uniref:Helix-turn-helix domain-containing protein n=1 Tax=Tsuneonella litorea TaxID=2976475 RepID=A0A9X2VZI3_9SPHN|nr:helix-turn-helix domain-containing protein [Tsuneonella litorea]MCT2558007.1 helix-turn-helix domain-containing protein [Tsuneonella litorea]